VSMLTGQIDAASIINVVFVFVAVGEQTVSFDDIS